MPTEEAGIVVLGTGVQGRNLMVSSGARKRQVIC